MDGSVHVHGIRIYPLGAGLVSYGLWHIGGFELVTLTAPAGFIAIALLRRQAHDARSRAQ
jgi:hypothetical protein